MASRRQFLCGLGAAGGLMSLNILGMFGPCNALPVYMETAEIPENSLITKNIVEPHMGTFVHITARHTSESRLDAAMAKAFDVSRHAEAIFTHHDSRGALAELNTKGVLKHAPQELVTILHEAQALHVQTGGAFNPAVTPVLAALAEYKVPTVAQLPVAMQKDLQRISSFQSLTISDQNVTLASRDMRLTLDGMAKGRIVDMMASSLESFGITDYCINAGGDIRVSGPKAWRIGIQDAKAPARQSGVLALKHGAVATSGNYESLPTKGYEHLVGMGRVKSNSSDGLAGNGLADSDLASNIISATVIAPTCQEADAMATALFVMAKEHGVQKTLAFVQSQKQYACQLQTTSDDVGSPSSSAWPV